jgi:hypothetical protein
MIPGYTNQGYNIMLDPWCMRTTSACGRPRVDMHALEFTMQLQEDHNTFAYSSQLPPRPQQVSTFQFVGTQYVNRLNGQTKESIAGSLRTCSVESLRAMPDPHHPNLCIVNANPRVSDFSLGRVSEAYTKASGTSVLPLQVLRKSLTRDGPS